MRTSIHTPSEIGALGIGYWRRRAAGVAEEVLDVLAAEVEGFIDAEGLGRVGEWSEGGEQLWQDAKGAGVVLGCAVG